MELIKGSRTWASEIAKLFPPMDRAELDRMTDFMDFSTI